MKENIQIVLSLVAVLQFFCLFVLVKKGWKRDAGPPQAQRISEVQPGARTRLQGKISASGSTMQSPYSKQPCVYYDFTVDRKERGLIPKTHHWVNAIADRRAVPFTIDDGTGTVAIELKNAQIVLKTDRHDYTGLFNAASKELNTVLMQYGTDSKGIFLESSLNTRERFLEPGDEVVVIGVVKTDAQGRLRMGFDEHPVTLTDEPAEPAPLGSMGIAHNRLLIASGGLLVAALFGLALL